MQTLLLDPVSWDLVADMNGNIAVAAEPYAQAQDAASQCKLFLGELYYDTTQGIKYFQLILGFLPPLALLRSELISAALMVPGIVSAQVFFISFQDRTLRGQVQVTNDNGLSAVQRFAVLPVGSQAGPSLDFSNPANSMYLPGFP